MAAVAEISKPDTSVVFAARRDGLRLVKTPRYPIFGQGGEKIGERPGQALAFRDGTLKVDETGVTLEDGGKLGRDEALSFLREHRLCGNTEEGFTEMAQAAPPVSQEELAALMDAVTDEDAMVAIIEAERAGWQRPALLEPAEKHLARLREIIERNSGVEPESAPKRAPRGR